MKWLPLLTGFALLATACAPQSEDSSMAGSGAASGATSGADPGTQSGQINCATAEADIRVLQSERTNAMTHLEGGGTTMVPSGLVTEPEFGVSEMGAGEYQEYLGNRITRIQEACGL